MRNGKLTRAPSPATMIRHHIIIVIIIIRFTTFPPRDGFRWKRVLARGPAAKRIARSRTVYYRRNGTELETF